jgi:hypothetical protein
VEVDLSCAYSASVSFGESLLRNYRGTSKRLSEDKRI